MNGKEAIKAMLDGEAITWGEKRVYYTITDNGEIRGNDVYGNLHTVNLSSFVGNTIEYRINKKPEHEFKPFEQVLVRDGDDQAWLAKHFGTVHEDGNYRYQTTHGLFFQCIPYKGNEHLLGTTDNVRRNNYNR